MLGSDAARVVAGRYVVMLDSADEQRALAVTATSRAAGGTIHQRYQYAVHGFAAATLPPAALTAVRSAAGVSYVEADAVVALPGASTDDVQPDAPWGLDRIDQRNLPLSTTYRYHATGRGVTAYIVDTGIRSTHDEFGTRVRAGFTAVDDGLGTEDCSGHGTHSAGLVGGKTYGAAKKVTLVPVRVLDCAGSGSYADVIAGIDWPTSTTSARPPRRSSRGVPAAVAATTTRCSSTF